MYSKLFIYLFFIIIITFITGCQSAMSVFNKSDSQYEKGLQHTKVKTIMHKNETKAIINVTYLNSVNSKIWNQKNQNFLVGIYISSDDENIQILNNKKYKIRLDGQEYFTSLVVEKKDKLYESIPLKNPWATYYILNFKTSKNQIINFEYSHSKFGKVILPFEKE